jgi:hypothetical protein
MSARQLEKSPQLEQLNQAALPASVVGTYMGDTITNRGAEHVLRVLLSAKPRAIEWNPHHELAYAGTLQP